MAAELGQTSTADDVLRGSDLRGKRVIVTGVSAGIGAETARALVAHGADVVGTARDLIKAERQLAPVREAAARNGSFTLVELDLASFASIRECTDRLADGSGAFDLIVANAGVMAIPFGLTADGFEIQFGTNHIGHFLLVNRLVPLLREGARVVLLSSSGHRGSDVDLDDPNFEATPYNPWSAYARSKTANILFAVELDRRLASRGARACAVHPGRVDTELFRHLGEGGLEKLVANVDRGMAERGLPPSLTKTPAQGAATSVWAGVVAPPELIGARFCEDCSVSPINDSSERLPNVAGVRSYAVDPERARRLWAKSEEWVGERFRA